MLQPVILAAGKGIRMQSELPKGLYPLAGKPLIRWVLDLLKVAETKQSLVVVGYKADLIQAELGEEVRYAEQKDISGTASAVRAALPYTAPDDALIILYCDQPFVRAETITAINTLAAEHPDAFIIGTTTVTDFEDWRESFVRYGRIIRSQSGDVERNVEYKDASEEERSLREVNPGIYCAKASWFGEALAKITPSPVSGEYYLTDIIEYAVKNGKRVIDVSVDPKEALGVNSVDDVRRAEGVLDKVL